jgi:hypothetical protein
MTELAKELFGSKDVQKIKAAFKKWFTVVEGIVPTSGFINGLAFPTLADFACVLMVTGQTPYVGAANLCGLKQCGLADYPKYAALVARIKAVPEVAAYLSKSKTMEGNPFGLPTANSVLAQPSSAASIKVQKSGLRTITMLSSCRCCGSSQLRLALSTLAPA